MRKLAVIAGLASLLLATGAQAVVNGTWAGTSNPWSTVGADGWTNGAVPNGVGDTATDSENNGSITQHIDVPGGVTVGNITAAWTGTLNTSWQITPDTPLTMNQDGAGVGSASIINNGQSTAVTNCSIFINSSTGAFTIADNLFLSNTSNSTRSTGSIRMRATINGAGNIWVENVSNDSHAGPISFEAGGNFSGNTTIASGATIFSRGDAFTPSPSNIVTIGAAGKGSAMLMWSGGTIGAIENNFVVAANSGGTLALGMAAKATGPMQIKPSNPTSSIRLDGDVSFTNLSTQLLTIGEPITGVGQVTKSGSGPMRVLESNTYQGGTVVDGGSLAVGNASLDFNGYGTYPASNGKLGSGNVSVTSNASYVEIESDVTDAISDTATVSLDGGGTPNTADVGYMQLDGSVNETIGALILGGVAQQIGTYGSTSSGAEFQNNEYFSGSGMLTVTEAVPEPASLSLLAIGAVGLLTRRRRRA